MSSEMKNANRADTNSAEIEGTMRRKPQTYEAMGQTWCQFTVMVKMPNHARGYDYIDCKASGAMAKRVRELAHDYARVRVRGRLSTEWNRANGAKRVTLMVSDFDVIR